MKRLFLISVLLVPLSFFVVGCSKVGPGPAGPQELESLEKEREKFAEQEAQKKGGVDRGARPLRER